MNQTNRNLNDVRLSCVLPVFNEAGHLAQFVHDLYAALSEQVGAVELVVVNDGSQDDTKTVVQQLLPHFPIRFINFSRNFGKEAAITAGLEAAEGDVVLLMDSDYQHPISLVPQMLARWQAGVDMVFGVIDDRSEESALKRWGSELLYKFINLNTNRQFRIPNHAGDFRLMDRQVVLALRALPESNRFMKGLYAWVGFQTESLSFKPEQRASGASSYNFLRLVHLALNGITSFSTLPLYMSALVGMLVSLLAILYGIDIVFDTLKNGSRIPGWSTLVVAMMFFSGVQFILIGVLGKYVGQIFEEVKRRPLYIVESTASSPLVNESIIVESPALESTIRHEVGQAI